MKDWGVRGRKHVSAISINLSNSAAKTINNMDASSLRNALFKCQSKSILGA